ncbi:formyltransferase family protein [Tardiphaga alba]|nr:formyltransferase family protein [Tardiphaga alba]
MFDTIILLTGPAEHSVFTTLLRGHNPGLTVLPVFTAADLAAIEPEWLRRARLISFTTNVIVPGALLDQLGYGAYNFHPGPPAYPGWAPSHFALYERASDFGCTMHRMVERVDAGPIVEVEVFSIPPGMNVNALEEMTYTKLVQMFWRMARTLATQSDPLIERAVRWGNNRNSRAAYEKICKIPLTISQDELQHRLHVFGTDHFGIVPSIDLHGFQFRIVMPEDEGQNVGTAVVGS